MFASLRCHNLFEQFVFISCFNWWDHFYLMAIYAALRNSLIQRKETFRFPVAWIAVVPARRVLVCLLSVIRPIYHCLSHVDICNLRLWNWLLLREGIFLINNPRSDSGHFVWQLPRICLRAGRVRVTHDTTADFLCRNCPACLLVCQCLHLTINTKSG